MLFDVADLSGFVPWFVGSFLPPLMPWVIGAGVALEIGAWATVGGWLLRGRHRSRSRAQSSLKS